MDKLLQWLKDKGMNYAELCQKINLKPAYFSRVKSGTQQLGIKYVEEIYILSEGTIGLEDLRPDLYKQFRSMSCMKDIL